MWASRAKRWAIWGFAVAALLALVACSSEDESEQSGGSAPAAFAGTIKIGGLYALSGQEASPLNFGARTGADVAINDMNAAGGIDVGGKRYRLEHLVRDSRSEAVATVAAAQDLIQQGITAAIIWECAHGDTAYQQFKDAGVLSFSVCPQVTYHLLPPPVGEGPEGNPLLFSEIQGFEPIIRGWFLQAVELFPDIRRFGQVQNDIFAPSYDLSAKNTVAQLNQQGKQFEYVGMEVFPLINPGDISTYYTRMKAKRPDLLYETGTVSNGTDGIKAAIDLDVAKYIMGVTSAENVKKLGDLRGHTIIIAEFGLPFTKGLIPDEYKTAVNKFYEQAGSTPITISWTIAEHDAMYVLANTISKVGSLDKAKIAQALPGQVFDGPFGRTTMGNDHITVKATGIIVVDNTGFTLYGYESADAPKAFKSWKFPLSAVQ